MNRSSHAWPARICLGLVALVTIPPLGFALTPDGFKHTFQVIPVGCLWCIAGITAGLLIPITHIIVLARQRDSANPATTLFVTAGIVFVATLLIAAGILALVSPATHSGI